jgi:small subunit ribosomal protein S18
MDGRKSFGAKKGARSGQAGKDGQRRPMFRRRKVCKFCSDKIDDINYKDTRLLLPFVPERAKILPRRISGTLRAAPAEAARGVDAGASVGAHPVHVGVGEASTWK